jgi:hypothetical protein
MTKPEGRSGSTDDPSAFGLRHSFVIGGSFVIRHFSHVFQPLW